MVPRSRAPRAAADCIVRRLVERRAADLEKGSAETGHRTRQSCSSASIPPQERRLNALRRDSSNNPRDVDPPRRSWTNRLGSGSHMRLAFFGICLGAIVVGQVAATWFGVPADMPSEREWDTGVLLRGFALLVPLGSLPLIAYIVFVKEPWVAATAGSAIAAIITFSYISMVTTNSSTAGLGYLGVIFYPWGVVVVGAGISDFVGRRRRTGRRSSERLNEALKNEHNLTRASDHL